MPTMLTCSEAFSLLLLVFGGFPGDGARPNRTQNERVNPCALPWSNPILSLCLGKRRRRQCAASRVFLISSWEKKNPSRPRASWVFCVRKSFHGARVPGIFDSFPARECGCGLGQNKGKNVKKIEKRAKMAQFVPQIGAGLISVSNIGKTKIKKIIRFFC